MIEAVTIYDNSNWKGIRLQSCVMCKLQYTDDSLPFHPQLNLISKLSLMCICSLKNERSLLHFALSTSPLTTCQYQIYQTKLRSTRNNNVTNYKILARQKIHENPQIETHQLLSLYNKDTQETILKLYFSIKKVSYSTSNLTIWENSWIEWELMAGRESLLPLNTFKNKMLNRKEQKLPGEWSTLWFQFRFWNQQFISNLGRHSNTHCIY